MRDRILILLIMQLLVALDLLAKDDVMVKDTLCWGNIEVIIDIPAEHKRKKFFEFDGVTYAYLLKDLSIVDVNYVQNTVVKINETDSVIWNVKLGNKAKSWLIKNDHGYSRVDFYIGESIIVGFARATDTNLDMLNKILDNIIIRYRRKD